MGYQVITHKIKLDLSQVVDILIFDQKVETINQNSETLIIVGSGTHKKVPGQYGVGISHKFLSNIIFHDEYIWATVTLSTQDNKNFTGEISYQTFEN